MNRTWLIARQEFIKYITRRGFFISLFIFPFWIVLAVVVPRWMSGAAPQHAFTIVDRIGGYEQAVEDALSRKLAHQQLSALAGYADMSVDRATLAKKQPRLSAMLDDADSAVSQKQFRDIGGLAPALRQIAPFLDKNAAPFIAPQPHVVLVKAPPALASASPQTFPAIAGRYLTGDLQSGMPARFDKLAVIVVIPKDFGQPQGSVTAQFFATDSDDGDLTDTVLQALTAKLRLTAAHRLVPQGTLEAASLDVSADMQSRDPTRSGDPHEAAGRFVSDYLPVALAILLFIVSMMNASVLLQGVIEEKSTRMIEVLLSCAAPRQILTGKLAGVIAVSLLTILIWGVMLLGLAAIASNGVVATVMNGIAATLTAQFLPLLLIYFLCQILIYGAIFLSIGSMANSLADAQALLGPAMIVLILPNLLIGGIMADPSGDIARIVSWIPIYTPFLMLVRLPSHPPLAELIGTALLSIATTAILIAVASRIFERHVLTTERPPALAALFKRIFRRA